MIFGHYISLAGALAASYDGARRYISGTRKSSGFIIMRKCGDTLAWPSAKASSRALARRKHHRRSAMPSADEMKIRSIARKG